VPPKFSEKRIEKHSGICSPESIACSRMHIRVWNHDATVAKHNLVALISFDRENIYEQTMSGCTVTLSISTEDAATPKTPPMTSPDHTTSPSQRLRRDLAFCYRTSSTTT
jgi:hypothetical protein